MTAFRRFDHEKADVVEWLPDLQRQLDQLAGHQPGQHDTPKISLAEICTTPDKTSSSSAARRSNMLAPDTTGQAVSQRFIVVVLTDSAQQNRN